MLKSKFMTVFVSLLYIKVDALDRFDVNFLKGERVRLRWEE